MKTAELAFNLPPSCTATVPPEARGTGRDDVRLLVTNRASGRTQHTRFGSLPDALQADDLLVVNDSLTIPAALPARRWDESLRLHLSTDLGHGGWIVEPRTDVGGPYAAPLEPGEVVRVPGGRVTIRQRYRRFQRLWLAQADVDLRRTAFQHGRPIQYPYVQGEWPIAYFQTHFGRVPGSAEMPSAGRPFTPQVIARLRARGVHVVPITLHTGVSSHEVTTEDVEAHPMLPEWYRVPDKTAQAVRDTQRNGGRVIAVGTTVVRALESAASPAGVVEPAKGFTEIFIGPPRRLQAVDALLTGLHAPVTSHLAMLRTFLEPEPLWNAYDEAVRKGYLWHEFGDVHLIA